MAKKRNGSSSELETLSTRSLEKVSGGFPHYVKRCWYVQDPNANWGGNLKLVCQWVLVG
jgi:hypothetical protein